MTEHAILGVKAAWLVAGFAGGVVSLSFLRSLTPAQATLSVFTGALTAAYMTPVAVQWAGLADRADLANGVAFLIGLSAMNTIPGVIKLSERFRANPEQFTNRGGSDK